MNWRGFVLLLILPVLMVAACYESPVVVVHEPGKYKGAADPLLAKQRSAQQEEILKKRVMLVQTDR